VAESASGSLYGGFSLTLRAWGENILDMVASRKGRIVGAEAVAQPAQKPGPERVGELVDRDDGAHHLAEGRLGEFRLHDDAGQTGWRVQEPGVTDGAYRNRSSRMARTGTRVHGWRVQEPEFTDGAYRNRSAHTAKRSVSFHQLHRYQGNSLSCQGSCGHLPGLASTSNLVSARQATPLCRSLFSRRPVPRITMTVVPAADSHSDSRRFHSASGLNR